MNELWKQKVLHFIKKYKFFAKVWLQKCQAKIILSREGRSSIPGGQPTWHLWFLHPIIVWLWTNKARNVSVKITFQHSQTCIWMQSLSKKFSSQVRSRVLIPVWVLVVLAVLMQDFHHIIAGIRVQWDGMYIYRNLNQVCLWVFISTHIFLCDEGKSWMPRNRWWIHTVLFYYFSMVFCKK